MSAVRNLVVFIDGTACDFGKKARSDVPFNADVKPVFHDERTSLYVIRNLFNIASRLFYRAIPANAVAHESVALWRDKYNLAHANLPADQMA